MKYLSPLRAGSNPDLLDELSCVSYRRSPPFLGAFGFRMYKPMRAALSWTAIWGEVAHLAQAVPDQLFNTVFFQRYEPGQNVLPHRDPMNNVGYTVIGLYGEFTPTQLRVDRDWFTQESGQVWVLPCTLNGVQGPQHEMRWEPNSIGTRYAIILNTITDGVH